MKLRCSVCFLLRGFFGKIPTPRNDYISDCFRKVLPQLNLNISAFRVISVYLISNSNRGGAQGQRRQKKQNYQPDAK
jgi:hypothetical protein